MQISFDLGTQDLTSTGNGRTADNASFIVRIDGNEALDFVVTAEQIRNAVGDNEMMHFDFIADVGVAGNHTVEFVDATPLADASNFGFSLDTIAIHDWFA